MEVIKTSDYFEEQMQEAHEEYLRGLQEVADEEADD